MKKILFFALIIAICVQARSNDYAREVLEEFLDARTAESPIRYERAAKALSILAAEDNFLHQYVLAVVSKEPKFPKSIKVADKDAEYYILRNRRKVFQMAEKEDNALAYFLIALDRNDKKLLSKAAKGGCVYALNELGLKLMTEVKTKKHSVLNANKKYFEAFDYFTRASEKRDPTALYNLGFCYLNGYGCTKDINLAIENLTRASDMNNPQAMNALGVLYRDGVDVEGDLMKAFSYFAESAKLGNSDGQYNYAMALLNDKKGAVTNATKAVSILEKAAKQRNVEAMNEYARCLYESVGVGYSLTNELAGAEYEAAKALLEKQDAERAHQAISWWLYCADKIGYPPAMHNLAKSFMEGRGVDRNEQAAVVWYTRAAESRYIPSMLRLAECYDKGIGGLKESRYNANWWRTRAHAERGERDAKIWLSTHKLQ